MPERANDHELMRLAARGDEAGFGELYARHAQPVFAYIWRRTGDRDRAADLRQEAFVRLWQVRKEWEAGAGVRPFLLRVASGLLADDYRRHEMKQRRGPKLVESLERHPPRPDQELRSSQIRRRLEAALAALPPRPAEVFSLKRDAGLSYREIADLLDLSPKTVERHMGRALARLREALKDLDPHR